MRAEVAIHQSFVTLARLKRCVLGLQSIRLFTAPARWKRRVPRLRKPLTCTSHEEAAAMRGEIELLKQTF